MSETTTHEHDDEGVESELLLEEMGYQPQLQSLIIGAGSAPTCTAMALRAYHDARIADDPPRADYATVAHVAPAAKPPAGPSCSASAPPHRRSAARCAALSSGTSRPSRACRRSAARWC